MLHSVGLWFSASPQNPHHCTFFLTTLGQAKKPRQGWEAIFWSCFAGCLHVSSLQVVSGSKWCFASPTHAHTIPETLSFHRVEVESATSESCQTRMTSLCFCCKTCSRSVPAIAAGERTITHLHAVYKFLFNFVIGCYRYWVFEGQPCSHQILMVRQSTALKHQRDQKQYASSVSCLYIHVQPAHCKAWTLSLSWSLFVTSSFLHCTEGQTGSQPSQPSSRLLRKDDCFLCPAQMNGLLLWLFPNFWDSLVMM